LISAVSRLLITQEDASRTSNGPSPDRRTWLYYAQLPQTPIPLDKQHFSALIHIRHMLYNEEGIKELGLPGGLDLWSLKNTEKVWEWSISARDDWHGQSTSPTQLQLTHELAIRILDYLDGSSNVHLDAPGEPILTDPTSAKVALLTVDPAHQGGSSPQTGGVDYNPVNPRGYVDHNQYHVSQVSKAPDVTVEQRQAALRIVTALTNVKTWLLQARKDAVALLKMNSDQLKQPQAGSILNDLVTQATAAYIGQLDPATQQVQPGVLQAHEAVGQLATLTITTDLPQRL
jgi:hypothetical protein